MWKDAMLVNKTRTAQNSYVSDQPWAAVVPRKGLRQIKEERGCHLYIGKINENLTRVLLVFSSYLYRDVLGYYMQLGTLILSVFPMFIW